MRAWLHHKLEAITTEFVAGGGYGDVYEVSYLSYLECLQVAEDRDPAKVWGEWRSRIAKRIPAGQVLVPMNRLVDRDTLVTELDALNRSLTTLPNRREYRHGHTKSAQPSIPPSRSIELFDLLGGDE